MFVWEPVGPSAPPHLIPYDTGFRLAIRIATPMIPQMISRPERPLVGTAIAVVIGTSVGLRFHSLGPFTLPCLVCGIALFLLGVAWQVRATKQSLATDWSRLLLIWLGAATLATANAWHHDSELQRTANWTAPSGVVSIEGFVTSEPACYHRTAEHVLQKFTATLRPTQADQTQTISIPDGAVVSIAWFGEPNSRSPRYGDHWLFAGKLKRNEKARHPPYIELTADRALSRRMDTNQGHSWMARAIDARQVCRILLNAGIENFDRQTAVLNSLMLGYMDDVTKETRSWFVSTGTIHIFAISGSHVIIVAGVIIFLLRSCRISRTRWFLVLVPLLIFYTFVTGLQVSAIRAVTMAALYWLAPCFGRRSDIFSALALSAIAILGFAPHQILSPGFVLSFVVTLALAAGYPAVMRRIEPHLSPDPLLAEPEPWRVRITRTCMRFVIGLIVASVVAELAAAPIVAYFFAMVVPIGIVANLIMGPLAFLSIVTGILALTTGIAIPWLGATFNHANVAFASAMLDSMSFLSSVPGGHFTIQPPPLLWIMVYYGVLCGLLTWLYRRRKSA